MPSRCKARSSRLHGTTRLLIFFTLLAGLIAAAHQGVNSGLRRIDTSTFGVTNRIFLGGANADIIISGSSRAQTHYDPAILAQITGRTVFNIGRNGSQTDLQVAVLKAYLKNNRKPALLIHNLDLFSFVTSREIFDPAQYVPYLGDEELYGLFKRIYPDAWRWRHLPLYGYAVYDMRFNWLQGLGALVGYHPAEDHVHGFRPRHSAWTGEFAKFAHDNPNGVVFEIEPQGVADLRELLTIAREREIRVLLVYSPEFHLIQSLEKNREEVFAQFRKLCADFDVPLWDFSDSAISRKQSWFYNSQHLNAEGASVFSRELAMRLAKSDMLPSKPDTSAASRHP